MGVSTNIFLFAHQDDETGVLWELHQLISRGEAVIVVYLTSGQISGKPSSIRNLESLSVMEKLGILSENIFFFGSELGIPDGKLSYYLEDGFQIILKLFEKIGKPNRLYFHAWEGGHQDHDAVHLIGLAIGRRLDILDKCFQFPLYNGYNLPSILFKLFSPLPENGVVFFSRIPWKNRLEYLAYCLSYPSQKKTWIGLLPFFIFHYIFRGTQILQPVSDVRIRFQPHSGKLLYERRGFYSYVEFIRSSKVFSIRFLGIPDK